MAFQSARVDAVKAYAASHSEEAGWNAVYASYTDLDIYRVVKHTKSPEGAIKKMAQTLGVQTEQAPTARKRSTVKTSRQMRELKEKLEGPQMSLNSCLTCLEQLDPILSHNCAEILKLDICAGCERKFQAILPADEYCSRCVVNSPTLLNGPLSVQSLLTWN